MDADRPQPGDELAGYRLGALLGEGSSGLVFAATDEAGAAVAVKILRPGADAARFAREARLARGIESRHVAPILALGETYLVLPLYEGGSLAARLRARGRLDAGETAGLAAQLGRGLDALHERGIVHRDVKPSNVLFDAGGTAALADFGLARAVDSTRLTRDGQLLGTPYYVAPELIEGREATPASDVYSLGCVLYECATGEPPFAAQRLAELCFAHVAEPAPDPRQRRPELPAGLAEALLLALEKDPAARPPTATALARMLSLPERTASPPRSAG